MPGEAYRLKTGLAVFVFVGRMTVDPLVVLILGVSVVVVASEADCFSPNDMLVQEDGASWDNLPALDKWDTIGTEDTPNMPALLETYLY